MAKKKDYTTNIGPQNITRKPINIKPRVYSGITEESAVPVPLVTSGVLLVLKNQMIRHERGQDEIYRLSSKTLISLFRVMTIFDLFFI